MRTFQERDGDVDELAWLWVRERARLAVRMGERASRRLSPGHVHDLRVACRRLRAALLFFDLTWRGSRWEELDTAARRVARIVAPLRERDVACRRLAALEVQLERRGGVLAVEAARSTLLERWRRKRHEEAELRVDRLVRRVQRLAAAAKRLVPTFDEEPRGQGWLDGRLAQLTAEVREAAARAEQLATRGRLRATARAAKGGRAAPGQDQEVARFEALHKARIAIKHQRYAWELSRSFTPPAQRRAQAAALGILQDRGGDLQDSVDLAARISRALDRGHVKGAGAVRLLASALAVRDAAAAAFVAALAQAWPRGADAKSPSSTGDGPAASPSPSPFARRLGAASEASLAPARARPLSSAASARSRAAAKAVSVARVKGTTS